MQGGAATGSTSTMTTWPFEVGQDRARKKGRGEIASPKTVDTQVAGSRWGRGTPSRCHAPASSCRAPRIRYATSLPLAKPHTARLTSLGVTFVALAFQIKASSSAAAK